MKNNHVYLKYLLLAAILTAIHQIDAQSIIYTLNTSSGGVSQSNSGVFSMGETFVGSISGENYGVQGVIQPSALETTNIIDKNGVNWEVTFYPNPALETLTIETDLKIEKVEIFDFMGRRTIHKDYRSGENIDLNELVPGQYFISLQINDKSRYSVGNFIKI